MSMYGFDQVDLETLKHPFAALAHTHEEWRSVFVNSLGSISRFLAAHDGFEVLAKCVNQVIANTAFKEENPRWVEGNYEPFILIEPAELEIVQALMLMQLLPRKEHPSCAREYTPLPTGDCKVHLRFLADAAADRHVQQDRTAFERISRLGPRRPQRGVRGRRAEID